MHQTVIHVRWNEAEQALSRIRQQVFVDEQCVPADLEWDGEDGSATHFLAQDVDGNAIGCARLLAGGMLGRMAVLAAWRGQGVGMSLLQAAIAECKTQGVAAVRISAQTHAMPFYARVGFVAQGEVYMDAGIPHQDMILDLSN